MTGEVREFKDGRAERARLAVLRAIKQGRDLTVAEWSEGRRLMTEDGRAAGVTVTVSFREAFSLVRVLGPIGLQNGDGSFTRLFAAMQICQRQLLRAPGGKNLAVVAALQVLQVAINDHLWACRDVPDPPAKARRPAVRRQVDRLR